MNYPPAPEDYATSDVNSRLHTTARESLAGSWPRWIGAQERPLQGSHWEHGRTVTRDLLSRRQMCELWRSLLLARPPVRPDPATHHCSPTLFPSASATTVILIPLLAAAVHRSITAASLSGSNACTWRRG